MGGANDHIDCFQKTPFYAPPWRLIAWNRRLTQASNIGSVKYGSGQKNGDALVPFCAVQTKTERPFLPLDNNNKSRYAHAMQWAQTITQNGN